MFLQRNKRGRLQQVRKPKDKEEFGRLKPTGTILDPPIWIDPGEIPLPLEKEIFDVGKGEAHAPLENTRLPDRSRRLHVSNATKFWVDTASAADRYLPRQDPEDYSLDEEPELPPPAPEPPRGPRRPGNRQMPDPPHGVRRPAKSPAPDVGDYPPNREPEFPPPSIDRARRTPRRAGPPNLDPGHHAPNQGEEMRPPTPEPPRGARRARHRPAPNTPHGVRGPPNLPVPDTEDFPPNREEQLPQSGPDSPQRTPRRVRAPSSDPRYHPLNREEQLPPPGPDPPQRTRRPARLPSLETAAYGGPPQLFDVERVFLRDPKELFAEASKDISLKTGTKYPCTQKDMDTCGGISRRTSRTHDYAQLRAMWFSQPNKGPSVSIMTAAREIFEHNDSKGTGRSASVKEQQAIDRLLAMLEKACLESWGPDLAIKTFCDLNVVFFRGKLRGNVCITWADVEEFPERNVFGHTVFLGQGKAVIQLNAQFLFFDWGIKDGRLFAQMLATVLHEMVHAYQFVNCPQHGKDGWHAANTGESGGHDKNFGTMMLAVNSRAFEMLGLRGDPTRYPCHEYAKKGDAP